MGINVGIDLGTTYSAVAVFNDAKGEVDILKNDLGKKYTPSVICIENGNVTIGEDAKSLHASGDPNTAAFYKSMMGEKDYTLYIDEKNYTPEELSCQYLKALKAITEEANGVKIDGAVITVPAYFDEKRRNATLRAGYKAGLNVLKIIHEPTAAIIAYGLTGKGTKNVMVYDLGGGTFDVTIAKVNGAKVDVITTNGNPQLGGKDWDRKIFDEIKQRFLDDYEINIENYPEQYKELQIKCEDAKKRLTSLNAATITVQCEGYSGKYEIDRAFFEQETSVLLNETLMLIHECFETIGGGFGWHSLDEVVLVGGSTRMPQVREMIVREYGKPPVTKNIDVDTIVAAGAAMMAKLCEKGADPDPTIEIMGQDGTTLLIHGNDIQDINGFSLGMLALDRSETNYVNSIIIPKDSKMNQPFSKQYTFSGQNLDIYVLQGESNDPFECALLYKYVITGMPQNRKNDFSVNFQYDGNGMVDLYAKLEDGTSLIAKKMDITESLSDIIARLRKEKEEAKNRSFGKAEIMFMLDTSYSMVGDPMWKAKQAMRDFVNELDLSKCKVSILDFADRSRWVCDFTNSLAQLTGAINSLDVDGPCGVANAETPLTTRGSAFKTRDAAKIIVVLTDGMWANQGVEIRTAAKLKDKGIVIYAVGFGGADESFLQQIASEKGARKIDLSKLSTTFKEIASSIATEI